MCNCSKPALLEGLEVDQYIWAIIQSLSNAAYDEVTIDTAANWKPVVPLGVVNEQQDIGLLPATQLSFSLVSLNS